jgi:AcrR family transcriptional regulator
MPRHADEKLEGRILDAAQVLWVKGGDHALTMRAVAKAAGTTTPSLYQRFPGKGEIRQALRRRAQKSMYDVLARCNSPKQVCEDYLKFALAHPNEYQLIFADWPEHRDDPRPNLDLLKQKFSQWMGGTAAEQTPLLMAVLALLHGTAGVLNGQVIPANLSKNLSRACITACAVLIENASTFKN